MKFNIKKISLIISIILITIILIDLLFNLSGKLTEKFENNSISEQELYNSVNGTETENGTNVNHMTTHVKSIESIYSGARYNIIPIPFNTRLLPTININIKTNNFNSMSVDNRILTTESTDFNSTKQTFKLIRIESMDDVLKFIETGTYLGAEPDEFPFYFIKSPGNGNNVLNIGDSELSIVKATNRPNQRFNISFEPKQALENSDKDSLNINIKLDQESIDKLISKLGLSSVQNQNNNLAEFSPYNNDNNDNNDNLIGRMIKSVENSDNYNSVTDSNTELLNCDNSKWIPREAIRSVCRGCEPDLIN